MEGSATRPETIDKCSKLREILEKLPIIRKNGSEKSAGSNNRQVEADGFAVASSHSSGSGSGSNKQRRQ